MAQMLTMSGRTLLILKVIHVVRRPRSSLTSILSTFEHNRERILEWSLIKRGTDVAYDDLKYPIDFEDERSE